MRNWLVLGVLVSLSSTAFAEDAPLVDKKLQAGIGLELLPIGELKFEYNGDSETTDTEMAFGIAPFLDYAVGPNISLGVAPRLLFNVKGEDGDEAAKQLDLRVRLLGRFPASPKMRIYGYVAPGYSILFIPDWPDEVDRPAGLVLALAGGAAYDLGPTTFATFELGYQLGWQGGEEDGDSVELSDNFLHFGVGVGTRF